MSTRFLFRSFSVRNYRTFKQATFPKFRRVNVIGGMNGVGKTTLLEAMFNTLDFMNPIGIIKPFQWRQMMVSSQEAANFLFHKADASTAFEFLSDTREGQFRVEASYGQYMDQAHPIRTTIAAETLEPTAAVESTKSNDCFKIEVWKDGESIDVALVLFNNVVGQTTIPGQSVGQGQIAKLKNSTMRLPFAVLLSKATAINSAELAQKFTMALQAKQKARILSLVRVIAPYVVDLTLLQVGGETRLCADIGNEVYVPLTFLGDGAAFLINIGLSIIQTRDGAMFLDEFDTAIHYSLLKTVWKSVFELAREYNTQIFAATHSKECILAAAQGAEAAGCVDDLQYMRLDRIGNDVLPTTYTTRELLGAFDEQWEVR